LASEDLSGDTIRYTTKEILKDIRDELVGVREDVRGRFHKLAATIEGLDKGLIYVERQVEEHQRVLETREPQIDALLKGAAVQDAVNLALDNRADRGFTRLERERSAEARSRSAC
jgi:hypothetical protein